MSETVMAAKEIQKLKLALTTDCVLECHHCNIDKKAGLELPFSYAEKGIRMLMDSPGVQKRLELYGGEPFLKMELLEKSVKFAALYSAEKKKLLSLSIATNGILLNEKTVDFLRKYRINLSISVSGSKENHDSCRIFPDGRGSWEALEPKIDYILGKMNPYDIVALECVAPAGASRLFTDLCSLVKRGFRVINIECVHGMEWTDGQYDALSESIGRFADFLFGEISKHNFIIPEPFIEFFRTGGPDTPVFCPMYRDLEMYPDGVLSFYPFAFLNYKESRDKVCIGSADKGLSERYRDCEQNKDEKRCAECVSSYYRIPGLSDGAEAYSLRTALLRRIFFDILKTAKKDKTFAEYARFLARCRKNEYKDYGSSDIK